MTHDRRPRKRHNGSKSAIGDLDMLCDRLVREDHAQLKNTLASLRGRLARLLASCDARSRPADAEGVMQGLSEVLLSHFAKEENILFPAFAALAQARRAGTAYPALPFPTVMHPVRVMEAEHERVEGHLKEMRRIVTAFVPPPDASAAWRAWHDELAAFEDALMKHAHFEAEQLFPRAVEIEQALALRPG